MNTQREIAQRDDTVIVTTLQQANDIDQIITANTVLTTNQPTLNTLVPVSRQSLFIVAAELEGKR